MSSEPLDDESPIARTWVKKVISPEDSQMTCQVNSWCPQIIEKQIALLRKTRFLVLYSKSWDIVENIAYALAAQWSGAGPLPVLYS